jgi:hypothetical protein
MAQDALAKALQTAIARIRNQLFLFIIILAIIIALTATLSPNIVIYVTILGICGIVAFVLLNVVPTYLKLRSIPTPPTGEEKKGQITPPPLEPAFAEIFYYNEGDTDAASKNRQEIERTLADEAAKSKKIKVLINTGEPIFAAPTSFLHQAFDRQDPALIKVLLLDPKAEPIISQRAKEAGYSKANYKKEILTSIDYCKQRKIDCKLYNFFSPWRLFIFDDQRVYVQFYLPKKSGDASPIYGYRVKDFSVGASFLQYFESIYSISRTPT